MVNWGAFSRDFVAGFRAGGDIVLRADENARRDELAQAAEKRAQGWYDADMKEIADSRAALALEFGGEGDTSSVAQKAATGGMTGSGGRSRTMAIPNKLGGPVEDGLPVPQSPEQAARLEATPEADEAAEGAMARERNYEPAPPARVGQRAPGDRARYGDSPAPSDELDAAPSRMAGIPEGLRRAAASGNKAAAARVRQLQDQARADAKDQRDFNERKRVNDTNIETSQQALTKERFDQALVRAGEFSQQAMAMSERLRGKENMLVTDPSIEPMVTRLVDTLTQGYAETPDNRSIKVDRTPAGLMVTTIDDRTGKPIGPPDIIKTVADLQDGVLMFGQIAQKEGLSKWIASASADSLKTAARGTRGQAEVDGLVDDVFSASAEQRLSPQWQEQINRKMRELEAKYPDIAKETVEVPVIDPETGQQMIDDRNRPVTQKTQVSRFAPIAELLQPDTKIKTAKGDRDAQEIIRGMLADPTELLKESGGSVPQMLTVLQADLVEKGLDPEIANVLVQQAAADLPAALQQRMAIAATPRSTTNTVSPQGEVPAMRGPQGRAQAVTGRGMPVRPVFRRDVAEETPTLGPQENAIVREPGAPNIYDRRVIPPPNVDPRARQIGSPFKR